MNKAILEEVIREVLSAKTSTFNSDVLYRSKFKEVIDQILSDERLSDWVDVEAVFQECRNIFYTEHEGMHSNNITDGAIKLIVENAFQKSKSHIIVDHAIIDISKLIGGVRYAEKNGFPLDGESVIENLIKVKNILSSVAPVEDWIDCNDRLPECIVRPSNIRKVFVCLEDGRIERAEYTETSGLFRDEWSDEFESVVYWQYDDLPQPPTDKESEA